MCSLEVKFFMTIVAFIPLLLEPFVSVIAPQLSLHLSRKEYDLWKAFNLFIFYVVAYFI